MALSPRIVALSACLVALGGSAARLQAFRSDTEQDLLPRIEHEQDPVRKAKLEIRLAHLKLARADEACQKDEHDVCQQSLDAYLEAVRSSWKDLKSSGKNAVRSPSGFRELDIALRENNHQLEDLKRRMPIEDRGVLDPVIQETDKVHNEVFGALFPSGAGRSKEKKSAPPTEPHGGPPQGREKLE